MEWKQLKNEQGFWSATMLIFLVTLALMGLGSFILVRNEGHSVSVQALGLQAEYAANGGAYFGLKQLALDSLDESSVLSIGNGTVTLDTTDVPGSSDIYLYVFADVDGVERKIRIRLSAGTGLVDKAIYTTGHVFNVSGKDSTGADDPDRVVTQASSVPEIDEATLAAMSTAQGHDQAVAEFDPADGYPNGSFYQPDGVTPNVTHVLNDLSVGGGRTIYGIFMVQGNVTLHGSSRINGVIYLPNPTSTIITGGGDPSESTITGGLVSHGDIWGTGNHISVQHGPEFMRVFCTFQIGPDQPPDVIKWEFL